MVTVHFLFDPFYLSTYMYLTYYLLAHCPVVLGPGVSGGVSDTLPLSGRGTPVFPGYCLFRVRVTSVALCRYIRHHVSLGDFLGSILIVPSCL
jgi:hypothetical protein